MFYENTATGEFGLSIHHVRQALPHMSIPDNTPEVGDFKMYTATTRPTAEWNQDVVECAPVDGQQCWSLVTADTEELKRRIQVRSDLVRLDREPMLNSCDWTQLADAPLTPEQVQAWREYRTALRDVTAQPGFPWTVIWPTPPTGA